jgi:hypothetical protein
LRRALTVTLALGLVGAFAFVNPATSSPEFKNKYDSIGGTRDCGDGDTVTYNGPLKMWPPNHKLQDVSVTATEGGLGTSPSTADTELGVVVELTDAAGGDGGPNHDPDYTPGDLAAMGDPTATVEFFLRSERSGKGDGRTYTVQWEALFDDGAKECTSMDDDQSPFVVEVPHDMRGGADWK